MLPLRSNREGSDRDPPAASALAPQPAPSERVRRVHAKCA
jgi:hypothetical protein